MAKSSRAGDGVDGGAAVGRFGNKTSSMAWIEPLVAEYAQKYELSNNEASQAVSSAKTRILKIPSVLGCIALAKM